MSFRIVDFEEGTFQLKVAGTYYKWKISKEARPGLGILFKTDSSLPQSDKEADEFEKSHSDREVSQMYDRLEKQAYKNILALNALVEPVDSPPIDGLSQLEFFSLCLEGDDPGKVYAFFLIYSTDSTNLREEIKSMILQITKDNPELEKLMKRKAAGKDPQPKNPTGKND